MVSVLLLIIALLLAAQGVLMLIKERETVRSLWWRFRGRKARKTIAQPRPPDRRSEAERRAAALEAKQNRNLWEYDGAEQPPIDPETLITEKY